MLKTRLLTALVMLSVFAVAVFALPAWGWLIFCALAVGAAAQEWARLTRLSHFAGASLAAGLAIAVGLLGEAKLAWLDQIAFGISAIFWVVCAPLWLRRGWQVRGGVSVALAGLLLLPAGLALVRLHALGAWVLMSLMALVWVADSAAFFAGRAQGKNKNAPYLSPGKTWEGVAGALLGVIAAGLFLNQFAAQNALPEKDLGCLLPQLALFTAVSIVGDLFESMIKRQAGVKDSGTLFPGHGGVLDRIDSLIATLPLGFLLLTVPLS